MNIVFAAAEAVPFVKVGGLGDVIGSLPVELAKLGHNCSVFIPYYSSIKESVEFYLNLEGLNTKIYTKRIKGVDFYLVKHDTYFGGKVYGSNDEEDSLRFAHFSKIVLKVVIEQLPNTQIIHSHDWHTALISTYLKELGTNIKNVFTIHNLAFQGLIRQLLLDMLNVPWGRFNMNELEFHGYVNLMKGAIVNADAVTTVSKTYASEILTAENGFMLDGVLNNQKHKLEGVVNGLDYDLFDPAKDKAIVKNYSINDMSGKEECSKALKIECGFDINAKRPIFGFVSRLTEQKGITIIVQSLQTIIESGAYVVMLASGNQELEEIMKTFEETHKNNFRIFTRFDLALAQRIYSGSDFYLMPSKFEPCGLSQLIAMRYGTIPVARSVGGLKDTIENGRTGILFDEYSAEALFESVKTAMFIFYNKVQYNEMVKNAMKADFSWEKSAKEFERIYGRVLNINK